MYLNVIINILIFLAISVSKIFISSGEDVVQVSMHNYVIFRHLLSQLDAFFF